jgi:hypothetical protein
MKPWDYYSTNSLSYPSKDEFTTVFVYSQGKTVWQGPYAEYKTKRDTFVGMVVEKVVDEAALMMQRRLYGAETGRLEAEFRRDLLEEHGVTENRKASRCYAIAYEHGHSAGFSEIASYFDEIVDLIKD